MSRTVTSERRYQRSFALLGAHADRLEDGRDSPEKLPRDAHSKGLDVLSTRVRNRFSAGAERGGTAAWIPPTPTSPDGTGGPPDRCSDCSTSPSGRHAALQTDAQRTTQLPAGAEMLAGPIPRSRHVPKRVTRCSLDLARIPDVSPKRATHGSSNRVCIPSGLHAPSAGRVVGLEMRRLDSRMAGVSFVPSPYSIYTPTHTCVVKSPFPAAPPCAYPCQCRRPCRPLAPTPPPAGVFIRPSRAVLPFVHLKTPYPRILDSPLLLSAPSPPPGFRSFRRICHPPFSRKRISPPTPHLAHIATEASPATFCPTQLNGLHLPTSKLPVFCVRHD